jgi:hypothetical protein
LGGKTYFYYEYKPEYPEMLVKHLAEGLSVSAFAGLVGVPRDTLYSWFMRYPEFDEARQRGLPMGLLFWEKIGRDNVHNKMFNHALWIYNMKCRFREEWLEVARLEQSINQNITMTPEQLSEKVLMAFELKQQKRLT